MMILADAGEVAGWLALAVGVIVFIITVYMGGGAIKLWFQARVSGTPVSLIAIVLMPWRKINNSIIVNNYIVCLKAGVDVSVAELETHYLSQGNVTRVVHALVEANKASIDLDFKKASAIDLAGRDILEAINTSMSTYREDSEISRFNRLPAGQWFQASSAFYEVFALSRQVALKSGGGLPSPIINRTAS